MFIKRNISVICDHQLIKYPVEILSGFDKEMRPAILLLIGQAFSAKAGSIRLEKTLIPISLKRADKIIAVSQFIKDEIIKYYKINPDKIECVYNAIGNEFLNPPTGGEISEEHLKEVKNKYNLPKKFILYIGTLQPRKNIPQLIEAFARIKNKLGDFKLVICGDKKAHNYDKRIGKFSKNKQSGK